MNLDQTEFDTRAFRHCLGQFSTGVTVVAAEHEGRRVGVTANSFASLSLDPPLVLWSIGRSSRAFPIFNEAPNFAINILAEDQVPISQRFSSKDEDKFAGVTWRPGYNQAPLLDGCAAAIECTTYARHDAGDHVLIIGQVTRFVVEQRKVLIFSQGRYSVGVDHPILRSGETASSPSDAEGADSFGTLLFKAHLSWSDGFDSHRNALNLSVGKGRLLYLLSRHRHLSPDNLVRKANLPSRVVEDEVIDLIASGDVERLAGGQIGLTAAGLARREAMRVQVEAYETESLRAIEPTDLAITKRTLAQYLGSSGHEM